MAKITLYEHFNGGGQSVVVTKEIPDTRCIGFQDIASYVEVESGAWVLYEHVNFGGSMFVVMEGEKKNLDEWNDKLSSLKPITISSDGMGSPSCTIYQHNNFEGRSLRLETDAKNLIWYDFNDQVSSIKVHRGVWIGYQHCDYKGNQYLLLPGEYRTSREAGIRNDDLSSFKAVRVVRSDPINVVKLEFDLKKGILNERPYALFSWRQTNNSNVEQGVQLRSTEDTTTEDTYQFNWEQGTSVTAEASLTMGIPKKDISVSGTLKIGVTASYKVGETKGHNVSNKRVWEVTHPSTIPPHKTILLTATVTEGKMNVPFTAVLKQGDHTWTERGTFIGTQYYELNSNFEELEIE